MAETEGESRLALDLASIEAGKRFYDAAVEGVAADCRSWIAAR
jgi:hypothetical protein